MNKQFLTKMSGHSMGLSFEDNSAGGGGTAVAPAPTSAAPAAAAAAKPKGIFDRAIPDSLKRLPGGSQDVNRVKDPPAAKPTEVAATTAAEAFNVTDDAGKVVASFKTQEEAQAYVDAGGEAAPAPLAAKPGDTFNVLDDDGKTLLGNFKTEAEAQAFMTKREADKKKDGAGPEALPRAVMGRFKTVPEVEEYIHQSGQHAQRLAAENKTLKEAQTKALADREAMEAAHKAEIETLRNTPAAKDLSKEELTALAKEDPAAAAEYIADKKFRERDAAAARRSAEDRVRAEQDRMRQVNQQIEAHRAVMSQDQENFPDFENLAPNIHEIIKITEDAMGKTPLRGHVWAEELAFWAAYGKAQHAANKNGKAVIDAAKKKNLRIAAAGASGTVSPAGGGNGRGSAGAVNAGAKESKGSRIVKAAPRNRFFAVTKTT